MNIRDQKNNLTRQQELFCEYLIQGYTQRKSYMMAYPACTGSKVSSIDINASKLFHTDEIQERYKELCQITEEENIRKAVWTKEQAITQIKNLMEKNIRESERYEESYEEEMSLYNKQIKEKEEQINNPKTYLSKKNKLALEKEIDELKMAKIKCNRRMYSNKNVNEAILNSIMQLNHMLGFDKQDNNLKIEAQVTYIDDIPENDEE